MIEPSSVWTKRQAVGIQQAAVYPDQLLAVQSIQCGGVVGSSFVDGANPESTAGIATAIVEPGCLHIAGIGTQLPQGPAGAIE